MTLIDKHDELVLQSHFLFSWNIYKKLWNTMKYKIADEIEGEF